MTPRGGENPLCTLSSERAGDRPELRKAFSRLAWEEKEGSLYGKTPVVAGWENGGGIVSPSNSTMGEKEEEDLKGRKKGE